MLLKKEVIKGLSWKRTSKAVMYVRKQHGEYSIHQRNRYSWKHCKCHELWKWLGRVDNDKFWFFCNLQHYFLEFSILSKHGFYNKKAIKHLSQLPQIRNNIRGLPHHICGQKNHTLRIPVLNTLILGPSELTWLWFLSRFIMDRDGANLRQLNYRALFVVRLCFF